MYHIKEYNNESRKEIKKRLNRSLYTESAILYRKLRKDTEERLKTEVLTNGERESLKGSLSQYKILSKMCFKNEKYIALEMSLDTETSNITKDGKRWGFVYIWQVGLGGIAYYGRTWESLRDLLDTIDEVLTTKGLSIVCLVHNLGFEFQFMRKEIGFKGADTFSKGKRDILNCRYKSIYFKDTLNYYNKKLSDLGNKVDGYNYNKVRHSKTELTERELKYIRNDVLILNELQREELKEKSIKQFIKIKTAVADVKETLSNDYCCMRRAAREGHIYSQGWVASIKDCTLNEELYNDLKDAFWGGYNHTGLGKLNKDLENVGSYDITSAYISAICSKYFPWGPAENITEATLRDFEAGGFYSVLKHLNKWNNELKYKYLVTYKLSDLILKTGKADNILNNVNIKSIKGEFIYDRHILSADEVIITSTLEDLNSILLFYNIEELDSSFIKIWRFKAYPLPHFIIKRCLELFNKKQKLKGDKSKKKEYNRVKTLLLSIFGLLGTDPVRDKFTFNEDGEAVKIEESTEAKLNKYNKSYRRYGYYAWAIWVSAYIREIIISFIDKIGYDFVYSDSDSIKLLNKDKYKDLFSEYNKNITEEIEEVLKFYHIDTDLAKPEGKYLGWFIDETGEEEGIYNWFKSLGCKKYIYIQNNELKAKCSGIKEEYLVNFLLHYNYNEETNTITKVNNTLKVAFNRFRVGLLIPEELAGSLAAFYNDEEITAEVEDYNGVKEVVNSKSSICLYNTSFMLGGDREAWDGLSNFTTYKVEN